MGSGVRVIVQLKDGERAGVVRERWFSPVFGHAVVVDFSRSLYAIVPACHVRRSSESGD